jgi:hypothetical protein
MFRRLAEVDLRDNRPRKEGRLHKERTMSTVRIHRRSATVVAFAMLVAALHVPASAAPPKASITINDVSVTEGNSGTRVLSFTARIKGRRSTGASVAWATENVAATAGSDYNAGSGTVSFSSGKTQKVNITVVGDQTDEPDETFNVNLSGAVNAKIADVQGVGTIMDDDEAATLSIADDVVGEGNLGSTASANFDVTLSQAADDPGDGGLCHRERQCHGRKRLHRHERHTHFRRRSDGEVRRHRRPRR